MEIPEGIKTMNFKRAAGKDDVTIKKSKVVSSSYLEFLVSLINRIISRVNLPSECNKAVEMLIPKSGWNFSFQDNQFAQFNGQISIKFAFRFQHSIELQVYGRRRLYRNPTRFTSNGGHLQSFRQGLATGTYTQALLTRCLSGYYFNDYWLYSKSNIPIKNRNGLIRKNPNHSWYITRTNLFPGAFNIDITTSILAKFIWKHWRILMIRK